MANSEQSKNATDYNYIDYYFYQKHLFLVVSPCQVCLGSCIGRCAPLGGGYCVCIPIHGWATTIKMITENHYYYNNQSINHYYPCNNYFMVVVIH